jgi:hypothetical protein
MSVSPKSKISPQKLGKLRISPLAAQKPTIGVEWLIRWQRYTSAIAFILIAATLSTYSAIVYSQKLWNREYQKLQTLQRQEREVTTAGELLKNQLAETAITPNQGLVAPTPQNSLFLEPAPQRPTNKDSTSLVKSPPTPKHHPTPLGY